MKLIERSLWSMQAKRNALRGDFVFCPEDTIFEKTSFDAALTGLVPSHALCVLYSHTHLNNTPKTSTLCLNGFTSACGRVDGRPTCRDAQETAPVHPSRRRRSRSSKLDSRCASFRAQVVSNGSLWYGTHRRGWRDNAYTGNKPDAGDGQLA